MIRFVVSDSLLVCVVGLHLAMSWVESVELSIGHQERGL